MNMKISTDLRLKRMLVNILSIVIVLAMAFPVTGGAYAQEPSPGLRAFPDQDRADGMFWPAGELVHLTINGNPFEPQTADDTGYVEFLLGEYDLKRGDTLTLSSGDISVTHIARQLFADNIDLDAQTVSGTVDGQQTVHVWIGDAQLYVEADESGHWYADFSSFGGVLSPGVCGNAEAWEGPGSTIIDWCAPPPNPFFGVSLTQHWFLIDHFLPETLVTILVYESEGSGIPVLEFSRYTDASGNLWVEGWEHNWDLEPGNYVVVTDGTNTKELLLEYVTLDVFDPKKDRIAGKALPGREVGIGVGNADGEQWMTVFAHEVTGAWRADFSTIGFDVTEDMWAGAHVSDEDGDVTAAHNSGPPPPPLGPRFTVFPEWEWFDGLDWPDGATVDITVEGKSECDTIKESWGGFFNGSFGEGCNLEIGDTVTFTDGTTTQTHVVRNLDITAVDPKKDTIAGRADAGTVVYVWPHDGWFEPLQVTAKRSGAWKVDLGDAGYDVKEGASGRSEIRDGAGNATAVDWYAPNPRFTVFPGWEFFDGLDWPDGASVKITVKGKPECKVTKESWGGFFNGNFGEGCDVEIGDLVKFTDGKTSRTHVVRNLAITAVDPGENTIAGTADPGTTVYVWPHDGWFEPLQAVADDTGLWQVDLDNAGYDLQEGASGRSEIRDDAGNATAVDWYVPNPRMTIYPDAQWFDGWDWSDGVTVTISVEGRPKCTLTRVPQGGEFGGGFPEDCSVSAGDVVYYTDGTTTIQHTVRNLAITKIDQDANTVSGVADTGADVHVWVWDTDNPHIYVTAQDGQWVADFGAFGMDLDANMGIQAEIRDENGNGTSVDHGTYTRMVASITENWFYVIDFDPLSTLNYSIYESQGGGLVLQSETTADVNGFAWIEFGENGPDLVPGNYLVVTDGANQKELVIEEITFDLFDLTNGQLSGTAAEPYGRRVWVGIGWQDRDAWMMDVNTKPKAGTWLADFGKPVPNDYSWVAAQIFDADGDASEVRPSVIVP